MYDIKLEKDNTDIRHRILQPHSFLLRFNNLEVLKDHPPMKRVICAPLEYILVHIGISSQEQKYNASK